MSSHRAHAADNRFFGRVRAKLDVAFSVLRELESQLSDSERRRQRSRPGRRKAVAIEESLDRLYEANAAAPIEVTVIDAEPLIVRSESEARWADERERLMTYVATVCAEATQLAAGQRVTGDARKGELGATMRPEVTAAKLEPGLLIRVPPADADDATDRLFRERAMTQVAQSYSLDDAEVGKKGFLRERWVSRAGGAFRRWFQALALRTRSARIAAALVLLTTAIRLALWLMGPSRVGAIHAADKTTRLRDKAS